MVLVQDHGEDGLCSASVLDCLVGEEDALLGCGIVVGSVLGGCRGGWFGLVACPFEEEDDAVYWAVLLRVVLDLVVSLGKRGRTLMNERYQRLER